MILFRSRNRMFAAIGVEFFVEIENAIALQGFDIHDSRVHFYQTLSGVALVRVDPNVGQFHSPQRFF